ncbi:acyltransferase family protein [Brachybacterium alimentarium]|uniref:acyltransferase family protein n=1 Tax=Brachybacterium alimentarium TaxID=47845 RepID=UPI003FD08A13
MSQSLSPEPTETIPARAPTTRLHHLDALRGGALLLGVLLHALMPFLPGGNWLVDDAHESWAAAGAVGVIHLFRMALFMMLAGYFGHMVLHRRGVAAYVKDRLTRIGLPLVAFWPGLFALMIAAVVLNEVVRGAAPIAAADTGPAATPGFLAVPTMHLWFLLLLLEIALVVVAVRAVLLRMLGTERAAGAAGRIGWALASPVGVVLAAVPYAAGLMVQESSDASIIEPYTLVPVAGASIGYSGAFLAGWFLRARSGSLARLERQWIPQLVIAVLLSPLALAAPMFAPPLLTAAFAALAGWAWVYGLLGLTARLVQRAIPWVRYLADASYWIYLVHFPLLLLVEVPLAALGAPILLQLAVALIVVMAVLLLSYDLFVRSTWIGAWLNGHRRPRAVFVRR